MPSPVKSLVRFLTARLRFPQLFLLAASLFVIDLVVPDIIPFADEILLALLTALLALLRQPAAQEEMADKPPIKDVTPRDG